ncbi:MAG: sugar O-acetyltransferase precursor [Bacteroidetes bacterium]|nr:sugar O-acetyltransferase precursor [Bacteroidota bacterium]
MKKIMAIFILLLMFTPMIFQIFGYKRGELKGYYDKTAKPTLTLRNFSELEFQNKVEKYIKDDIAFSDFLIRLSNEIRYRIFNYSNTQYVIIGKNNYLYMESYLNSYYGLDYQGDEKIFKAVRKLAQVRDSLNVRGVDIVFMIAPGKVTYYPEYLPSKYKNLKKGKTNYQTFSNAFNKYNINYLDFNRWICSMKDTISYRLYSNTGVHWGQYASYLAVDSLIKYLDYKYDVSLPQIKIKSIKESRVISKSDDDVEQIMNLVSNIPDEKMPRLKIQIDSSNKDNLRVLSMGDSYFFGLNEFGLMNRIFYDSEFWYYFKEVRSSKVNYFLVNEYDDLKKEIEKNKLILIVFTEGNLHTTPFEFCNELYSLYCENNSYSKELAWQKKRYKIQIDKDKNWRESVKNKAKKLNITYEKALDNDAEYMAKEFLSQKDFVSEK